MDSPAHQFMDAAYGVEIVKENITLRQKVEQLQNLAADNENQRQKIQRLEDQLNGCKGMFCRCTDRCDELCITQFIKPSKECLSPPSYSKTWSSNFAAWTICFPCQAVRFVACGGTYVCCGANCSKMCLCIDQ